MTSYPIRISFHKHFCDSPKLLHLKCERSTCTIIVCFEQTVRTCCETTRQWDRFQCSSCDKQRTLCIFIHNLFADNESVGSGYYLICSLSRLLCCVGSGSNVPTALQWYCKHRSGCGRNGGLHDASHTIHHDSLPT